VTVFAQIVAEPDASVFPSGRKAADFSLAVSPPALVPRPVFEFRGIRIGEEMKEAERTFLSLKVPFLSSNPGLCGSDGINRIETCIDVLDNGGVREYDDVGSESRPDLCVHGSSDDGEHLQQLRHRVE
jgi:hypothetical protein